MFRIDDEFRALIPPLTPDERRLLGESIEREGVRDPLVVWLGEDVLLDGHNRYEIATRLGKPYNTHGLAFTSRNEAAAWIIRNQFGRRNLTGYQRGELALALEKFLRPAAEARMLAGERVYPDQNSGQGRVDREIAKAANLSHDTIHKVRVIAEKAPEEVKAKLRAGTETIHGAYKKIAQAERIAKRDTALPKPVLPGGPFDVILVDPPWRYDFAEAGNRAVENQYPTMSVEELCVLSVPAAADCVLFMWATAPKLLEALEVIEAWGFEYKTNAVWDKQIIGMGYWFRGQHELLLVGTKGSPSAPDSDLRRSSVFSERRGKHSEKPEAVLEAIESMLPGRSKVELFARATRPGWASWGNQVPA